MLLVLNKIAPIFLLIAFGFVLRRLKVLDGNSRTFLNFLVVSILLPCMLFESISSKELGDNTGQITYLTMIMTVLLVVAITFVGYIICRLTGVKDKRNLAVHVFCYGTSNCGLIGFPVMNAVFGKEALFVLVMQNIALTLLLFSLNTFLLHFIGGGGKMDKEAFKKSFLNPNIISSFIGLAFLFLGWKLPLALNDCVSMLGDSATPLSMLLIGALLGDADLKAIFGDIKFIIIGLSKMILSPVVAFLILYWLPIPDIMKLAMTFACSFPIAMIVAPVCEKEGYNSELASSLICYTTLLSVLVIPLCATVLSGIFGV